MRLQDEVRTKSEDISDEVMSEVTRALRRRVRKVDRSYDIPYIAGYSVDGRVIFVDRHLPSTFRSWTKRIRIEPFILTHELVEKALIDELRLHYLHAHQIALRTEQAAVQSAGVSWSAYQRFIKKHEKQIETERLTRVPKNLDLTPYRDEKDFDLLAGLVSSSGGRQH
jgi:hypothetical protein